MAYTWWAPKYDFIATDGLTNNHMNAIGENIATLHSGNGVNSLSSVAIASDFAINMTDHAFVTSSTGSPIDRIRYKDSTLERLPGNIIYVLFAHAGTVTQSGTGSGDYKGIAWRGTGSITPSVNTVMAFLHGPTYWHVIDFPAAGD